MSPLRLGSRARLCIGTSPNRQILLDELASMALREIDERLRSARLDEVPVYDGVWRVVGTLVDVGDPFVVLVRERPRPEDIDRVLCGPSCACSSGGAWGATSATTSRCNGSPMRCSGRP
jgi:hypothetical protein